MNLSSQPPHDPLQLAVFQLSAIDRARRFFQVAGWACLMGFAINLVLTLLPPAFGDFQWRAQMVQMLSDRAILLLFGAVLLMYGLVNNQRLLRPIALASIATGVALLVSILLVVSNTITLRSYTLYTINQQAGQVLEQLEAQGTTNEPAPPAEPQFPFESASEAENKAPEVSQTQVQRLSKQSEAARRNAGIRVLKAGVLAATNLLVVGIGLIALGRMGLSLR